MNDGLKKAQAANAARRAAGEKVEHLTPAEKAKRKPTSLRLAVNAYCWECIGAGADPNPRWEIGNCLVTKCPLYPVRPYGTMKEEGGDPTQPSIEPRSLAQCREMTHQKANVGPSGGAK